MVRSTVSIAAWQYCSERGGESGFALVAARMFFPFPDGLKRWPPQSPRRPLVARCAQK